MRGGGFGLELDDFGAVDFGLFFEVVDFLFLFLLLSVFFRESGGG
jgi:hypothetical protein